MLTARPLGYAWMPCRIESTRIGWYRFRPTWVTAKVTRLDVPRSGPGRPVQLRCRPHDPRLHVDPGTGDNPQADEPGRLIVFGCQRAAAGARLTRAGGVWTHYNVCI